MVLSIISFTNNGIVLSKKLESRLCQEEMILYTKCTRNREVVDCNAILPEEHTKTESTEEQCPILVTEPIGAWARKQMEQRNALLFIGACGIAVRAIAPCLTDKLHDSPVLVMDEKGSYVIPILSGHMGGANELANLIAEKIGAMPVITTATDINGRFAVDMFAKRNGLHIVNKEGIARVSSKVLAGTKITMSVESGHFDEASKIPQGIRMVSYPPKEFTDIVIAADIVKEGEYYDAAIYLTPKEYVIGMGCRRGKEPEKIRSLITKCLEEIGISQEQILALASIDKKKDEQGFLAWSRNANVPFITYSAEELQEVEGDFFSSEFVKDKVGVDNVCERAALKVCGNAGKIIYEKHAEDGMTIAIAKREWRVVFDEA